MNSNPPEFKDIARMIVEACHKASKPAMTFANTPESFQLALEVGFTVIVVETDAGLMKKASDNTIEMIAKARKADLHKPVPSSQVAATSPK